MSTFADGWLTAAAIRRLTRCGAALLISAGLFAQPSRAVPITYELDDVGAIASGTFAGTPFSNASVILTFEADTTTVVPFTVQGSKGPVTGYVNLVGTGTVTVIDANATVIGGGTFLPSAGIFVSVDGTNGAVGIGSFGVPPGNPSFPGQVAYPVGMLLAANNVMTTYDLKSDVNLPGFAISCVGFPATVCPAGIALATTAGDLILDHQTIADAVFSARVQTVTPFSNLTARAEIDDNRFALEGRFTLGATSNGISPLSEAVTLRVDSYSATIPPGSFTRGKEGGYKFKGKIADVRLEFSVKAGSPSAYTFHVEAAGAGIPQSATPPSVTLTIGDDSGTATASTERD